MQINTVGGDGFAPRDLKSERDDAYVRLAAFALIDQYGSLAVKEAMDMELCLGGWFARAVTLLVKRELISRTH